MKSSSDRKTFKVFTPIILGLCLTVLLLLPYQVFGASLSVADSVGAVVMIDFNEGEGSPSGWNVISQANKNGTEIDLLDFITGSTSGITYTASGFTSNFGGNHWPAGEQAWLVDGAGEDMFAGIDTTVNITLSNLSGSSYSVELVSSNANPGVADYKTNGNFATRNFSNTVGVLGDDFSLQTDGYNASNWLIWDDVSPIDSRIVISITGRGGANAIRLREYTLGTNQNPNTFGEGNSPAASGGMTITNNSGTTFFNDDGDVIDFSHSSGSNSNVTTDLPGGVVQRWSRVWDCYVTDVNSNGGNVDVTFDFDDAGMGDGSSVNGPASNYKLLHRTTSSGDFTILASGTSTSTVDNSVSFSGVSATGLCSQITLGTTNSSTSPTAILLEHFSAGSNFNNNLTVGGFVTITIILVGGIIIKNRSRKTSIKGGNDETERTI
jgi:hypothetical protein